MHLNTFLSRRHKTIGASGLPSEREIKESRAAQECLVQMIEHCTKIFVVPSYPGFERDGNAGDIEGLEPDAPFLTELGVAENGNYKTYLLQIVKDLLKVEYFFRLNELLGLSVQKFFILYLRHVFTRECSYCRVFATQPFRKL